METLEAKYEVDVDNEQVIDSIPLPPSCASFVSLPSLSLFFLQGNDLADL